ncbi:MAG: hypothetical protein ACLFVU_05245 [Phycisphaerae bacterium]
MTNRKAKIILGLLLTALVAGLLVSDATAQRNGAGQDRTSTAGRPTTRPGFSHPRMRSRGHRFRPEMMERMGSYIGYVNRMKSVCFDPELAGMIAVGGLRRDVERKPEETAEELEELLKETESLGLRNCIRMSLRDIYKAQGEDEKVLKHLRKMIAENDAALAERERSDTTRGPR